MDNQFFRHFLATLSYRATVAIEDAPSHYPHFEAGNGIRTPVSLLSHISDVLDLGYSWFVEIEKNKNVNEWQVEVERFYRTLEKLDQVLIDQLPIRASYEKLLQGPFTDAMAHIGQLVMLRRLADAPVQGKNYIKAPLESGEILRSTT